MACLYCLSEVGMGKYEIIKINANKHVKRRLGALGMLPNTIIEKKRIKASLVKVRGSNLYLTKGLAKKIMVKEM